MLLFEVVDPGGSLPMLPSPCLNKEMPAESFLAGSNGDGGKQLRPDDGGASSLAGDWRQPWHGGGSLCRVLDSKFCDFRFSCSYVFIRIRLF
jgi:hypothetical protein